MENFSPWRSVNNQVPAPYRSSTITLSRMQQSPTWEVSELTGPADRACVQEGLCREAWLSISPCTMHIHVPHSSTDGHATFVNLPQCPWHLPIPWGHVHLGREDTQWLRCRREWTESQRGSTGHPPPPKKECQQPAGQTSAVATRSHSCSDENQGWWAQVVLKKRTQMCLLPKLLKVQRKTPNTPNFIWIYLFSTYMSQSTALYLSTIKTWTKCCTCCCQ